MYEEGLNITSVFLCDPLNVGRADCMPGVSIQQGTYILPTLEANAHFAVVNIISHKGTALKLSYTQLATKRRLKSPKLCLEPLLSI